MLSRWLGLLLICLLPGGLLAQNQIRWAKSLDVALATAKSEKKPILICVNMDNDAANDRFVKEHYRDAKVVAKSRQFVCLFISKFRHQPDSDGHCPRAGFISCGDHVAAELAVRKTYFNSNEVVAPQHVFLRPNGKLLRSKLYFVTKAELLALWDSVLGELFPKRLAKTETKAKSGDKKKDTPARTKEAGEGEKTARELKALIIQSTFKNKIKELARQLIKRDKDQEAKTVLAELLSDKKAPVIRLSGMALAYGFKGDKAGIVVLEELLKHSDPLVRSHVAVAFEDTAEETAVRPLIAQLKKEKEERVRKNLVRALGTCGPNTKTVEAVLLKSLRDKSRLVQRNAAIALGNFEVGSKAEKYLLTMALRSGGGRRGGGRGRRQSNQAALYALVQMGSTTAKEKAEKQIGRGKKALDKALERMVKAFDSKFDPRNPATLRWRRKAAGDKIERDLDPVKGKKKKNAKKRGKPGKKKD